MLGSGGLKKPRYFVACFNNLVQVFSMNLEDKVAIVTGAASGIGEATACRFATEGTNVVGYDIDEVGLAALAEKLSS